MHKESETGFIFHSKVCWCVGGGEGGHVSVNEFPKKCVKGSILEATLTMWKACFTKEATQVEWKMLEALTVVS